MTNPADIAAFLRRIEDNDLPIYVPPGFRFQNDPRVAYQWFPVKQSVPDQVYTDIGEFLKGKHPVRVEYYQPRRVLAAADPSIQESIPQEPGFAVYYMRSN